MEPVSYEKAIEIIKASSSRPELVTLNLTSDKLDEARLKQLKQCICDNNFKGALNYSGIGKDEVYTDTNEVRLCLEIQIAIRENNTKYWTSVQPATKESFQKIVSSKMETIVLKKHLYEDKDNAEMADLCDDFAEEVQKLTSHDNEESIFYLIGFRKEALDMRKRLKNNQDCDEIIKSLYNMGKTYINVRYYTKALPELETCLEMIKRVHKDNIDSEQTARCLYSIAVCHYYSKDNIKALDFVSQSLEMFKRLYHDNDMDNEGYPDHAEVARALAFLSTVHDDLGDSKKALEYVTIALDMRKRLCGVSENGYKTTDKPLLMDLVRSYNLIAHQHYKLNEVEKSSAFYKNAIELLKTINDLRSQLLLVDTLREIARKYGEQEKFSECIECFLESFKIRENLKLTVANKKEESAFYMLSMAYVSLKDFKQAILYYTKAFDIHKKLTGIVLPSAELVEYYKNFGIFHMSLNEIELARDYFLKALDTYEKFYPNGKGDEALIQNLLRRLGDCYGNLGNFPKSLVYQLRLIDLMKTSNPDEDSDDLAHLLCDTGTCYQNLGKPDEGLKYKLKSYEMIQRITHGADSEDTVAILFNLSTMYHVLGDLENMEKYCKIAFDMSHRVHKDTDSLQIAEALTLLGVIANSKHETENAIKLHTEALEMRKRLCKDEGNEDIVNSYSNIGLVYDRVSEHEKAFAMHKQALDMSRAIANSANSVLVAACLEFIGHSCASASQHEKALEYYLEALAIKQKIFADVETNHGIELLLHKIYASYDALKDYTNSLKYHLMAYELAKKTYKPVSKEMVEYLNNLGASYSCIEPGSDKALEYYTSSLDMCKKLYSDDEPIIGLLLSNIGAIYASRGDHSSALQYLLEAFKIGRKSKLDANQKKHDLGILMDIATCYEASFDYDNSLQYKLDYLDLLKKETGDGQKDGVLVAQVLDSIGETYKLIGNKELMIEYKLKALEVIRQLNEKDKKACVPELIDSYTSIADIYKQDEDYQKAVEYFALVSDMTRVLLDERPDLYPNVREGLKKSLLSLIECYSRLQDQPNVEKFEKELEKMKSKTYSKACVIS